MADEEGGPERDASGRFASKKETDAESANGEGGSTVENASDITAPSIGPNTVIEYEEPEERLARHEQSDVDAMGQDKRRAVVGNSYGPSLGQQARLYGVAAAIVIGFILLAGKLDQPPDKIDAKAPWVGTKQAPKPLE